jgi:hypothetical protein
MEEKRGKSEAYHHLNLTVGFRMHEPVHPTKQSYRHGAQSTSTLVPNISLTTLAGGYRETQNLLPTHPNVCLAFT